MRNKSIFHINKSRMNEVVDTLNEARKAYYNENKEIMTNKEYDELYDRLEKLEKEEGKVLSNSPTRTVGYSVTGDLPKFKHTYKALSLDKTKDKDELVSRFRKGIEQSGSDNDKVVVMYKEDGSTLQVYYKQGKLDKLVTRGNGEVGSIVTHNANVISGIPTELAYPIDLVVRGEAVMSYEEFERINEQLSDDQKYANPRNLASATLTMIDNEEASKRHLMFQAFNLVAIENPEAMLTLADYEVIESIDECLSTFSGRLALLKGFKFNVVPYYATKIDNMISQIEIMTAGVKSYEYPVDGLVAAMDNYQYSMTLEGTDHHPNIMQGYAFKWADETKETVLREIEWSPSRTGRLNPVAIFDPIELEGTIVSRASLHNLTIMRNMRIHVGNIIKVCKSNMIIPYIVENTNCEREADYTDEFIHSLIPCCPTCGAKADIRVSADGVETVYCSNEKCPEKLVGKFVNFCSRDCMDIQGMSEETIKKLVDNRFVKEYSDFFTLDTQPNIALMPGFGEVSWRNMCQAALNARTTDFVHFVTALSIPNIGKGQAKMLKAYMTDNYRKLAEWAHMDSEAFNLPVMLSQMGHLGFNFEVIDGFGSILSQNLSKWLKNNFDLSEGVFTPELKLLAFLKFTDEPKSNVVTLSPISGKTFCITGKLEHFANRQELVDKIESFGGKWIDSVSSKTDYLINNDVTSSSGKNKKAKELNIPIISEDDFIKLIGE